MVSDVVNRRKESTRQALVLIFLMLSLPAWADPPMSARKDAAENVARGLLTACSETDDVKQCLIDRGAECEATGEEADQEFSCTMQISVDFTKLGRRSGPPDSSDPFDVTYRIYQTKKGWKGKTRSVRLAGS